MSPIPKWRTAITLLLLAGGLGIFGLVLVRYGDVGVKIFADLSIAYVLLGGGQVIKSGVQHLAGGGGLKGAVAALTTSAKPEGQAS